MTEYTEQDHAGNVYRRNDRTADSGDAQGALNDLRQAVARRGSDPELTEIVERLTRALGTEPGQ